MNKTKPEPPPMRVGDRGDTIDRHGVRRKADGSLRKLAIESVAQWFTFAAVVVALAVMYGLGIADAVK